MQDVAVRLLDAVTVSSPPDCLRRTQPAPMTAMADNLAANSAARASVVLRKRSWLCEESKWQLWVDERRSCLLHNGHSMRPRLYEG